MDDKLGISTPIKFTYETGNGKFSMAVKGVGAEFVLEQGGKQFQFWCTFNNALGMFFNDRTIHPKGVYYYQTAHECHEPTISWKQDGKREFIRLPDKFDAIVREELIDIVSLRSDELWMLKQRETTDKEGT